MKILGYAVHTPGHAFPFMPILAELRQRSHAVVFAVFHNRSHPPLTGVRIRKLDWKATQAEFGIGGANPLGGLSTVYGEPTARTLERLIREERPDCILVDPMLWGGMVAAEASGLPWVSVAHSPTTLRGTGLDVRGPGFKPAQSGIQRISSWITNLMLRARSDQSLPLMNDCRRRRGLAPLAHVVDYYLRPPLIIAATAPPFEYARPDWPPSLRFVGPLVWEPAGAGPRWVGARTSLPLILLAGSSIREVGPAHSWIQLAIQALADEPYEILVTAAHDEIPKHLPARVRVAKFVPHLQVLPFAACVVCHGGAGIAHKALASGVPVVAIPFAYDRFEVARRLEVARAGVMLPGNELSAERLRAAVKGALNCKAGAEAVGAAFARAGGAEAAADYVEDLLRSGRHHEPTPPGRDRPAVK